jgi:L-2-hydroxyglutarate oxidase LhgO
MIHGGVEARPNAVLAFKREGYTKSTISLGDMATYLNYEGFWAMAKKHWRMSVGEFYRSYNKGAFVKALQRLIPDLRASDVHPAGAGVRAQALEPSGLVRQQLLERASHESRHRTCVTGIRRPRATRRIVGDEHAIHKPKKSAIA